MTVSLLSARPARRPRENRKMDRTATNATAAQYMKGPGYATNATFGCATTTANRSLSVTEDEVHPGLTNAPETCASA